MRHRSNANRAATLRDSLHRTRGAIAWPVVVGLLLLVVVAGVSIDWFSTKPPEALARATYVGRSRCINCHQAEHADFVGSHHDRAMELASEDSVLGDFDDAMFQRLGVTTKFFRKDGNYYVNTEGPDGKYHDYQVKYTFGVDPLQQYMVEFSDGRVQVLRVSWDTHKQLWFYVPPPDATDERLTPGDPTHWTGIAQNWNTACAECHSTALEKNFDLATDSYKTTFAEIDVSCEACHGPASLHLELAASRSLFWDRRHGYGLAKLKGLSNVAEIESCAPCHSRRTAVHPDFRPGRPLTDFYTPATLDQTFYHADGQILDEVYVYGSFLQSKMYSEGVRCTDCHNPHSLKLKFEGNALCAQCHVPSKYDTPAHHHHQAGTPGASCVECHMPATTYMVVDPRRDHSIRVPRPDLTVQLGTPNACNACHTKQSEDAVWAAAKVVEWYGPQRKGNQTWAPAIAAGRAAAPEGEELLLALLSKQTTPAIVQATACYLLAQYDSPPVAEALGDMLQSPSPQVRQAAAQTMPAKSPQQLLSSMTGLLSDVSRPVRIAASLRLLAVDRKMLEDSQANALDEAIDDYREQLKLSSERASSHLELAQLALMNKQASDAARAEGAADEYRAAVKLEPYLAAPYEKLADVLAAVQGDPDEIASLRQQAIERLERDIELVPDAVDVRYRLGLQHYRLGDLQSAERRLAEALEMAPGSYRVAVTVAQLQLGLYASGEQTAYSRALKTIEAVNRLQPGSPEAEALLRELMARAKQPKEASDSD